MTDNKGLSQKKIQHVWDMVEALLREENEGNFVLFYLKKKKNLEECLGGSVKPLTLEFDSGQDLRVRRWSSVFPPPWVWSLLGTLSFPLSCLSPNLVLKFHTISPSLQKTKQNKTNKTPEIFNTLIIFDSFTLRFPITILVKKQVKCLFSRK